MRKIFLPLTAMLFTSCLFSSPKPVVKPDPVYFYKKVRVSLDMGTCYGNPLIKNADSSIEISNWVVPKITGSDSLANLMKGRVILSDNTPMPTSVAFYDMNFYGRFSDIDSLGNFSFYRWASYDLKNTYNTYGIAMFQKIYKTPPETTYVYGVKGESGVISSAQYDSIYREKRPQIEIKVLYDGISVVPYNANCAVSPDL